MSYQNRIKQGFSLFVFSAWIALASLVSACSGTAAEAQCPQCGVISSIQPRVVDGEPSAAGAIAGAIVGGVIGHQFGGGSGKDAATAAGAVGGAIAGREIEKRNGRYTVYDVVIDMHEGADRSLTLYSVDGLSVGENVRVTGERVVPA